MMWRALMRRVYMMTRRTLMGGVIENMIAMHAMKIELNELNRHANSHVVCYMSTNNVCFLASFMTWKTFMCIVNGCDDNISLS